MRLIKITILFFTFFSISAHNLQAQENQTNKPPSLKVKDDHKIPTHSINLGAQKLRESVIYNIDENTRFGINNGFKLGFKINF